MNIRQLTQDVRLRHWAEQMHSRQDRGLSIREWCREQGIAEKTYYYWQRKLRAAAAEHLTHKTDSDSQALVPGGWALCESTKPAPAADGETTLPIEIGHCRIMVDNDTDPDLLTKVCRVLVSLC